MCTYSKNQFRHLIMFFPIQHPQFARYPSLLNNMTNTRPPDVYVDREGHQWTLAAWAKPARFFLFHYPLLGLHMESQDSRKAHWTCQTRDCNFKWMMLKKEGWIYRRHHHNHKMERQTPAELLRGRRPGDPTPPDAMADLMKLQGWRLLAADVSTEDQLAPIVLKKAVSRTKKTDSELHSCEPFNCRRSRCRYKIRWLPHRSTVWEQGHHNHAIASIIRRRLCQLERMKNLGNGGDGLAKMKKTNLKHATQPTLVTLDEQHPRAYGRFIKRSGKKQNSARVSSLKRRSKSAGTGGVNVKVGGSNGNNDKSTSQQSTPAPEGRELRGRGADGRCKTSSATKVSKLWRRTLGLGLQSSDRGAADETMNSQDRLQHNKI